MPGDKPNGGLPNELGVPNEELPNDGLVPGVPMVDAPNGDALPKEDVAGVPNDDNGGLLKDESPVASVEVSGTGLNDDMLGVAKDDVLPNDDKEDGEMLLEPTGDKGVSFSAGSSGGASAGSSGGPSSAGSSGGPSSEGGGSGGPSSEGGSGGPSSEGVSGGPSTGSSFGGDFGFSVFSFSVSIFSICS